MSYRMAITRITAGFLLLAMLYLSPLAYGMLTSGDRLSECLRGNPDTTAVVVRLSFEPGPTQVEALQAYGRYGGSGGDMQNVILLRVTPDNRIALSRLYWVESVRPEGGCATEGSA